MKLNQKQELAAAVIVLASVVLNTLFCVAIWAVMVFSDKPQPSAGAAATITIMMLLNVASAGISFFARDEG